MKYLIFLFVLFLVSCKNEDDLLNTLKDVKTETVDLLSNAKKHYSKRVFPRDTVKINDLLNLLQESNEIQLTDKSSLEKIKLLRELYRTKSTVYNYDYTTWMSKIDTSLNDVKLRLNIAINELCFINNIIKYMESNDFYSFNHMEAFAVHNNKNTMNVYFIPAIDSSKFKICFYKRDSITQGMYKPIYIYDTMKIVARYNLTYFTIINKTNEKYEYIIRHEKNNKTADCFPFE